MRQEASICEENPNILNSSASGTRMTNCGPWDKICFLLFLFFCQTRISTSTMTFHIQVVQQPQCFFFSVALWSYLRQISGPFTQNVSCSLWALWVLLITVKNKPDRVFPHVFRNQFRKIKLQYRKYNWQKKRSQSSGPCLSKKGWIKEERQHCGWWRKRSVWESSTRTTYRQEQAHAKSHTSTHTRKAI